MNTNNKSETEKGARVKLMFTLYVVILLMLAISGTAQERTDDKSPSYIDLSVSASGYTDHAYIQIIDTAKFEFDIADATKLSNKIFNLATMSSDSIVLSINVVPGSACEFDIPISLWNTWDDTYTFSWTITQDLLDNYSISLEDRYTSEVYDLNSTAVGFDFYISKDAATKAIERFNLHFETASIDTNIVIETTQSCEDLGIAKIDLSTSQYGVNYILLQDNKELETLTGTGGKLLFEIDSALLTSGTNSFIIRATWPNCTNQGSDFNVQLEYIDLPEIITVSDGLACDNSPITLKVTRAKNATSFRWYELEYDKEPITETDSTTFVTPILAESHLYYVSAINALGCESERIPVEAKVNHLSIPTVTIDTVDFDNYVLRSSYTNDNQWLFNNTTLIGETNQLLNFIESGYYMVQVNSDGCSAVSDSVEVSNLVLAVEELSEQFKISMYPNPATDKVMIDFPKITNQKIQVMLYTSDGKVQAQVGLEDHHNSTITIDLRSYVPGTYILKMVVDSVPYNYRLIKQ